MLLGANWVGADIHFCNLQPDTSLRCEFPGLGLVNRGNGAAQSWSSLARGGMVKLMVDLEKM